MKLTEAAISKIPPQGKADVVFFDNDLPGFGLRIRAGGSRSWVFQYKLGPKHRRITLGKYPALPSGKARETAVKLYAEVRLGKDPQGTKADSRARAAETVGAVLKIYLAGRRGELRASSYREFERHLLRNLAPIHGLHVTAVNLRTVAAQLTRITRECGPAQANRTRESLSAFLNWCARQGMVETNAATFANRNKEIPRDRVLSDSEIAAAWKALPHSDYGAIIKLLLLTGQRLNEIAELRWSEINLEHGIITLPGSRTKNRRAHVIPITEQMRSILLPQPRHDGRDFIFGRERGFSGWSHRKRKLDQAVKIPPWVIHDIRRSTATGMARIGILPHVVEAVLNHISGHKAGVAGIYNRFSYEQEKADALTRWGNHVAAIVGVA